MLIIDENLKLTRKDNLTHRRFAFDINEGFDMLIIKLSYSPTQVLGDEKVNTLKEAIEKYLKDDIYTDEDRYGTLNANIENFLTTSLFYEGEFVGAYHNKVNNQEIIVSTDYSSRGYKKHEISPGNYELVLSMHACNSEVIAKISLEAVNE